jgi:hypothetical protein
VVGIHSRKLDDSDESVRITADRRTGISFIPVDHVVEDFRVIVEAELETPGQSIYHVSGESDSTVGDFPDYVLKLIGLEDRLFLVHEDFEDPSLLERSLAVVVA